MPKFFEKDGVTFMEVIPVKSLFHSNMIHDVITKGRKFVVNMNTGELTIHTESKHSDTVRDPNNLRYKPDGKPTIKITPDIRVALIQLNDQFAIGNGYGVFYYGPSKNRRKIRANGDWLSFDAAVRRAFINM
jgi:hypothetical protein